MMNKRRALFISSTVLISFRNNDWCVDWRLAGAIFDLAVKGYLVVVVIYARDYETSKEREEVEDRLKTAFEKSSCNFESHNFKVMFIADLLDPQPFWSVRRCWGLDMGQSILVAETHAGSELAKIIEVGEFFFPMDFFQWIGIDV